MSGPDVTTPPREPSDKHLRAVRERIVPRASAPRLAGPAIFIRRFQYSEVQTPGWTLKRARALAPTGRPNVIRLTQLSLAAADEPARLLKLDVYETPSPEAARELMVELLTGFQSLPGQVELDEEIGEADLVFPLDTARLVVRGNLVMLLANAGAQVTSVGDVARSLDRFLVGVAVPSTSTTAAGTAVEVMMRFTAGTGSLRQRDDGVVVTQEGTEVPAEAAFDAVNERWRRLAEPGPADPSRMTRRTRKKS
jgi:hypothetical protein